eukprot:scaffold15638_cov119-Isochrysis_galbana.AAC.2
MSSHAQTTCSYDACASDAKKNRSRARAGFTGAHWRQVLLRRLHSPTRNTVRDAELHVPPPAPLCPPYSSSLCTAAAAAMPSRARRTSASPSSSSG